MRTTLVLPDDLLSQAKVAAAASGRTLSAYVADSLRAALRETEGRPTGAVRLPTSPGGPLPGVDLHDSAALETLMAE